MTFDVAMPIMLLAVTLASLLLNKRAEPKLKGTLEEREFSTRDAVLLVIMMGVMISAVFFLQNFVTPLMILFLFSYSMLLFIFTYVFAKQKWYLAIVPPMAFVVPYIFLRDTTIWSPFLSDVYGVIFAVLITLYIGSLFTWKSTLIFAGLLTLADIILVLVTGIMVQAAQATQSLSLPVLIVLPIVPLLEATDGALALMGLGLGDFFFAGLLAIQTAKTFGRKFALATVGAMTASFFVFEVLLLTYWRIAFPGTVMIISGWLPLVGIKILLDRRRHSPSQAVPEQKVQSDQGNNAL